MQKLKALTVILGLALAAPNLAIAQDTSAAETEALARLVNEIRLLENLVSQAEQNSNPEARTTFNYDLLRSELQTVGDGVADYLTGNRAQPRRFEPLDADYGDQTSERTY